MIFSITRYKHQSVYYSLENTQDKGLF